MFAASGAPDRTELVYHAMWLFRKSLDLSRATLRPVTAADLTAISRLLRDGSRRYYGLSGGDLPALLADHHGVALDAGGELWGVALTSRPAETTSWLRALALAEGVELRAATDLLLPALHRDLHERGIVGVYYGGDEGADSWLTPALRQHGYLDNTEVIVYEKQQLDIPDGGNPHVQVRPVAAVDLPAVLRIDRACFEAQWTKDDTVLGPAVGQGQYFVLAELEGTAVGYAYATTHFGARLVHLVRIAVDPARRNQQIGVRLLAELTAYADELGATLITLNTQAYNLSAQRLYHWFGFRTTGERQPVLSCPL